PRAAGGEAGGLQAIRRLRAMALVIVCVQSARVVGVVLHRADGADEIGSRVDGLERADFAVEGPGGVLELVLVEGVVEQRDRLRRQRSTVGALRRLKEYSLGIEVLIALREQRTPVVVDLPEGRGAQ